MRAYLTVNENRRVENLIQTYADDVVPIYQNPEEIATMRKIIRNIHKNGSKREQMHHGLLFDDDHHRCSLAKCFKFYTQ
jgi:hypothetical protein